MKKKFNWDTSWKSNTLFSWICWITGAVTITASLMLLLFKFCGVY